MYGLSATGRRLWTEQLDGFVLSPAVVGRRAYVPDDAGTLLALDVPAGGAAPHRAWRVQLPGGSYSSPSVGPDGNVYTAAGTTVSAVRDGGEPGVGRLDVPHPRPAARNGKVWFGDHLGQVDVLDVATGRLLHRDLGLPKSQGTSSEGTGIWTAPLVDTAENTSVGTAPGHVYGFAPDGRRLWDADVGGVVDSYPALPANGTLLIGSTNGILCAFHDG